MSEERVIERITPSGHIVIERPEGLYLIGPLESAVALAEDERHVVRFTLNGQHRVELCDPDGSVAEWGASILSEDEALRFALGAFLGSYEDPQIHKTP